jgi:hypothetical protein
MSSIQQYICNKCNKVCVSSQGLKNHIAKKHKDEEKSSLICKVCNKTLASKYSCLRHEAKCEEKIQLKSNISQPTPTIIYNITNNNNSIHNHNNVYNTNNNEYSDDFIHENNENAEKELQLDNLKKALKSSFVTQPYKYIVQDAHNFGAVLKEHLAKHIIDTNENNINLLDDDKNNISLTYKDFVNLISEEFYKYDRISFFLFLISPYNYIHFKEYFDIQEAKDKFFKFNDWLYGKNESFEQQLIQSLMEI